MAGLLNGGGAELLSGVEAELLSRVCARAVWQKGSKVDERGRGVSRALGVCGVVEWGDKGGVVVKEEGWQVCRMGGRFIER